MLSFTLGVLWAKATMRHLDSKAAYIHFARTALDFHLELPSDPPPEPARCPAHGWISRCHESLWIKSIYREQEHAPTCFVHASKATFVAAWSPLEAISWTSSFGLRLGWFKLVQQYFFII